MKLNSPTKFSIMFTGIVALYCVALATSNVIAGKLWQTPIPGVVLTAGVFLFPIVYIIGDVIPEVYGLHTARKIIWLGFGINTLMVGVFLLTVALPHPEYFQNQEAFKTVLAFTPRLLIASACGYLVGTNSNAYTLTAIKKLTKGKWLWMRTIGSTLIGETLDSALFVTVGFAGLMPGNALIGMIIAQAAFKTIYEAAVTPLTYLVVNWFKRREYFANNYETIPFED